MSLTKVSYSMISGAPANVLDFGADPTGVADSRQAIVDAMTASTVVYFPKGTYKSSTSIDMTGKDMEIIGDGSTLTFTTGYLSLGGTIGSAFTISSAIDFGANVIDVTGGSFTAGSILQLVDTTDYSFSLHRSYYRKGQLFTVESVSSNTVTCLENSLAIFATGANIEVKKITPAKITINNFTILAPDNTQSTYACRIVYAKNLYTSNSTYSGGDAAGLVIADSKGANIIGCTCFCQAPNTSGLQYGISVSDSENITVDGCRLYGTRHAAGLGGSGTTGTKFTTIQNSTLSNDELLGVYAADIHGDCSYTTYQNNTIYGGAAVGGAYASYLNNIIFASASSVSYWPAINFTEVVGGDFIIDGNQIYMPTTNNSTSVISTTATSFWSKIDYSYHAQITNNEISVAASQTNICVFGTHYLAPTVQPSVTWENNKFRNDCSNVLYIILIASIRNPSTLAYVAAEGPFRIKDFTLHSTMTSAVKVFNVSQGTIATGATFFLPQYSTYTGANIVIGTSTRTVAITYPFDYGTVTPPVHATVANCTVQNGSYPFVGIDSATATGCTGVFTTGNTGATLSADTAYYATFTIGGAYTRP